jgi:hypothetical protein
MIKTSLERASSCQFAPRFFSPCTRAQRVFGVPNGRKFPSNQRMCYCREDTTQHNSEPQLALSILFLSRSNRIPPRPGGGICHRVAETSADYIGDAGRNSFGACPWDSRQSIRRWPTKRSCQISQVSNAPTRGAMLSIAGLIGHFSVF